MRHFLAVLATAFALLFVSAPASAPAQAQVGIEVGPNGFSIEAGRPRRDRSWYQRRQDRNWYRGDYRCNYVHVPHNYGGRWVMVREYRCD